MKRTTFERLRELVYANSGIALGDSKEALVSARIAKRIRKLGLQDQQEYLAYVDTQRDELVHLVDVISTNVTNFFREPSHFEFVSQAIVKWLSEGQRRLRLWCAACATGEEPYSLAMTVAEATRGYDVDVRILATDISTAALAKAKAGLYPVEKLKSVQRAWLERYFEPVDIGREARRVGDTLKAGIAFHRLNLASPPYPMQGPFDIVLCRNVMIYFDNPVRKKLLADVHRLVRSGGYLLVGHAESLAGMMSEFKPMRPSIYIKR
jgi:chemotaxis protein methyltransferase CheR